MTMLNTQRAMRPRSSSALLLRTAKQRVQRSTVLVASSHAVTQLAQDTLAKAKARRRA